MAHQRNTFVLLAGLLLALGLALPGQAQISAKSKKKQTGPALATLDDDSRNSARTASRKTADPFGFLGGGKQKKNKDCGCPGTKKGERQRRKEYRSHRKRK
ncbi:MAG: hypothetical protein MUD08_17560 [Cytophagales bacterium]|jgi:hypothetical protein|nr:hypothetical protein [Cytophagales bacterium]